MWDDVLVDGHGRGVHLLGLDELHISSTDGLTFFVLVVAQERSVQFRASISREFQKRCFFQWVCAHTIAPHTCLSSLPQASPLTAAPWGSFVRRLVVSRAGHFAGIWPFCESMKIFFACGGLRV